MKIGLVSRAIGRAFSWLLRVLGAACHKTCDVKMNEYIVEKMKSFFTYIIQSELDGSFYIGQTENLRNRLKYHNDGASKYTSRKIPWRLVYYEEFPNRSDAMKREKFLKKQRNKQFYQKLIENWSGISSNRESVQLVTPSTRGCLSRNPEDLI